MSAFLHCASQSGPSSSKYLENFEELNFDCRIVVFVFSSNQNGQKFVRFFVCSFLENDNFFISLNDLFCPFIVRFFLEDTLFHEKCSKKATLYNFFRRLYINEFNPRSIPYSFTRFSLLIKSLIHFKDRVDLEVSYRLGL